MYVLLWMYKARLCMYVCAWDSPVPQIIDTRPSIIYAQTLWSQGAYRLEIISARFDNLQATKGLGGRDYAWGYFDSLCCVNYEANYKCTV